VRNGAAQWAYDVFLLMRSRSGAGLMKTSRMIAAGAAVSVLSILGYAVLTRGSARR